MIKNTLGKYSETVMGEKQMFSLIVVDDEINIREGLREFISGKFPDINVNGCFEDGRDAIEYLENNSADIVITDIKMLNVSGIEVAKYVHENKKGMKVIILSGFREFEYARSAMAYNVKNYLIKPTDMEELSEVISDTVEELLRESEEREHLSSFEKYANMFKNELLSDILMGAIKDKDVLCSRFELLSIGLEPDDCGFGIVNLYIDDYRNYISENWNYGKDRFNEAAKNFIEAMNTQSLFLMHALNDKDCMKFICICSKNSGVSVRESLEEHLEKVKMCVDENLKMRVKFEVERIYLSIDSLLSAGNEDESGQYDEKRMRLLMSHINLKNFREIDILVESCIDSLKESRPQVLKNECLKIVEIITDNLECEEFYSRCSTEIEMLGTADEYKAYMKKVLAELSTVADVSEVENAIIRKAKEFVDENFGRDISLEDVAEHVFLNPAYFSRYFKQYTGENLTTYLLKKRMSYAKRLLEDHYDVGEVAVKCGYSSTKYFVQSFKKYFGITPKEYRINSEM